MTDSEHVWFVFIMMIISAIALYIAYSNGSSSGYKKGRKDEQKDNWMKYIANHYMNTGTYPLHADDHEIKRAKAYLKSRGITTPNFKVVDGGKGD